jgi:hypothetical protein
MNISRKIEIGAALVSAAAAVCVLTAACDHPGPPSATVKTCTAEIVAHPKESTPGPGCRGLTQDQLLQATLAAMQQGARG